MEEFGATETEKTRCAVAALFSFFFFSVFVLSPPKVTALCRLAFLEKRLPIERHSFILFSTLLRSTLQPLFPSTQQEEHKDNG